MAEESVRLVMEGDMGVIKSSTHFILIFGGEFHGPIANNQAAKVMNVIKKAVEESKKV